jgi:type II secretory pathway predicted ATPase ExeA
MYESFFGFARRPFPAMPTPELYFPAAVTEEARTALARCVERGDGPALVIGGAGLGKSLLLAVLAKQFEGGLTSAILCGGRLCSRRALLQAILFELDLPYRDLHEGELRLSLADFLCSDESCPGGLLLMIDEAHTLPLRLLDELRMISNVVRDATPQVRLVLAGDGSLEERLGSPKLHSLNQRVAARCYLEPLSHDETQHYVRSQIAACLEVPSGESLFDEEALGAMYTASDGIPRLINQLADHVLLLAHLQGRRRIAAQHVEEAWADLQRLPQSWPHEMHGGVGAEPAMTIEFGALGDVSDTSAMPASAAESHGEAPQSPPAPAAAAHEKALTAPSGSASPETPVDPAGREISRAAESLQAETIVSPETSDGPKTIETRQTSKPSKSLSPRLPRSRPPRQSPQPPAPPSRRANRRATEARRKTPSKKTSRMRRKLSSVAPLLRISSAIRR